MSRRGWKLATLAFLAGAAAAPRARALTLETVLAEVARNNPSLEARRLEAEAARGRVSAAAAWTSPMVEVGVANVPVNGRFDMDPMTMKMVGLVQRVPISGSLAWRGRAARQEAQSASADAELAHWETLARAWETYADTYYARQRAGLALDHRGVMERLVQSARARYDAGRGRLEDVLRAQAERARTEADRAAYEAEARAGWSRLSALRGHPPGSAPDSLAPPPESALATGQVGEPESSHPRVRAQQTRTARDRAEARARRRMVWPDLELRASYGFRERLETGVDQEDMFSASVGLMVPLFARSGELAEARALDARSKASDAERRDAELQLAAERAAARAALDAASRAVTLLRDTVVSTQRRAVEASLASYTAGASDLWRTLESSHALYDELLELTRASQDLARAQARLLPLMARSEAFALGVPSPSRVGP